MSSFNNKRRLMKTLITTNIISCGCTKLKPSDDVLDPTPKPKISLYQHSKNPNNSLASSTTTTTTSSSSDRESSTNNNNKKKNTQKPSGSKLMNSIAIEKESNDPHEDFRNSVLQMIVEREIYSEPDLQELLECFLELNAACHHQVIVEAFMEICEEIFPNKKAHDSGGE